MSDLSDEDFVPKTTSKIVKSNSASCADVPLQCSICLKLFTRQDNLKAHLRNCSSEKDARGTFPCKFCGAEFSSQKDACRHEKRCSKNPDRNLSTCKCPNCKKCFSRKDNLIVHLRTCGPSETPTSSAGASVQCSFCPYKSSFKSNIKRHEKVCAKNPESTDVSFKCKKCHLEFKRSDNLAVHQKKCSVTGEQKKRSILCLYQGCSFSCWNKGILIDHLKDEHDSSIKPMKELNFESEIDFQSWKDQEEAKTLSYYSLTSGAKGSRSYLYCQHDGSDKPHRKKGSPGRITCRKNRIGQIKRGVTCISKMTVVRGEDDGSVFVKYFPSHSHPLSKHDLAHQPLSKATNTFINGQLALNVPSKEIYRRLQSSTSERDQRGEDDHVSRNMTITERRIRQRAARRRSKMRLHQRDEVSTFMLVEILKKEKYNPVVIYKPMGMDILAGPQEDLSEDQVEQLFMLGIQTNEQRKLMVQYAHQVLIVDDTHNVTQYENIKLFNMVIRDENNRGWAVAHLIANCMSSEIIAMFTKSVNDRCIEAGETLDINCVMSDDDSALINGVQGGIGKVLRHILCLWHLDETFKEQIRLKVPRALFDTVYDELRVLIYEEKESEFLKHHEMFLKNREKDSPAFAAYFSKLYSCRTKVWAMCYRKGLNHGNVNTTGHVESFHNGLKTKEWERNPNKRIDDLANSLLDMERRSYEERQRLDLLGYSEPPHKIKEKHLLGVALPDGSIEEVGPTLWSIQSASNTDQRYHVSRVQDFCPKDLCFEKCTNASCHDLCPHLYICSCKDKVPLCKHVHKLQSYTLKDNPVSTFQDEPSQVNFYDAEDNVEQTDREKEVDAITSDLSVINAYNRLEASVASLADLVQKRAIPAHFLPSCDLTVSDLVKKCTLLSFSEDNLPKAMPISRVIAPTEKLATQQSQLLPFKRKKKKKPDDLDFDSKRQRRARAKKRLLGTDAALVIGPYRVTQLDLKSLPLTLTEEELQDCRALNEEFQIGWLTSEVINAFLYSLALTNDKVYVAGDELASSMARGNVLKRIFGKEMREKDLFLFPANFTGDHWVMIAALAKEKEGQILYMDSLQRAKPPAALKCIDTIKKVMKKVKPSVLKWDEQTMKYCLQNDSFNCGAHACWFADQIIRESEEFTSLDDIGAYRTFMYNLIVGNCLQQPSDEANICIMCSSEESQTSSDDIGLRCEKCGQLYHLSCLGVDLEEVSRDTFVCPQLEVTDQ